MAILPRFGAGANDLARFKPDPADTEVGAFVASASPADAVGLDVDDLYTLLTFARRSSAGALRTSSRELALRAVRALTMVDTERIDFRDLSVDFPLYAVRELGGDLGATIDDAVRRSADSTARAFDLARGRAARSSLADCALVRIESSYGTGFVEDWTGHRRPPVRLAEAVVPLLDLIDEEGSYRTNEFKVSELPGIWFGMRDVMKVPVVGCVSFSGEHIESTHPYSHTLLVFIAQLRWKRDAKRLAESANGASRPERPSHGSAAGDHLAVFIGGSVTANEGSLESAESLRRFSILAATSLDG